MYYHSTNKMDGWMDAALLLCLQQLPSYLLCKENDENAIFCNAKLAVGGAGNT